MRPHKRIKIQGSSIVADRVASKRFAWELCKEDNEAERIAIKENAVDRAMYYTRELAKLLRKYIEDGNASGIEAINSWLDQSGRFSMAFIIQLLKTNLYEPQ